eukprot:TRINITY_DN12112_c0_g1_i1.p1 TRINITY_DN12112_c0_g1~~TRINITY_DN12112_c0_g1_i1.p1  ORF type:complete len:235 (-),score=55.96 TRINITY_DN12112_c0_g1_i1:336-1040(-)
MHAASAIGDMCSDVCQINIMAVVLVLFLWLIWREKPPQAVKSAGVGAAAADEAAPAATPGAERQTTQQEAETLRAALGVPAGATVMVNINDVLLTRSGDTWSVCPKATSALGTLCQAVPSTIIIARLPSHEHRGAVEQAARAAGMAGPDGCLVPAHRLLYATTTAGVVAMVRQVEPALMVTADTAVLRQLAPFQVRTVEVHAHAEHSGSAAADERWEHAASLSQLLGGHTKAQQ